MNLQTKKGRPYPLGATVTQEGINFAIFSRNATQLFLELFKHVGDHRPIATINLDGNYHRTGDIWHIFVHNLGHGQLYGFRADGPYSPEEGGHRFNVNKLLFDPYSKSLAGAYDLSQDAVYGFDRTSPEQDLSFSDADSAPYTVRSIAMEADNFNWENDTPPRTPLHESVIYEVHLKGFTYHSSAHVAHPGTYLGLVEKIPHLLDIGVTAIELLPIFEFNEREPAGIDPQTQTPLTNYWGYSPLGFFTPEISYSSDQTLGGQNYEFKTMVKALHRAGIEVILDVVFNHTGEGNEMGPTLVFKGLDNSIYYMLDGGRRYKNYSGCGNTFNCNHPVVKQYILDCLRYWVVEMHVDGFRFDLATILGRSRTGEWIGDLSLLYDIGGDPILRGCKLIAESWDADGLYKVGGFPRTWAEWNGRFRDDVRRFVRGDRGMVAEIARRIGGSRDLFAGKDAPAHSINFITAHDGFTMRDLVSYSRKHNTRNGEDDRDGAPENFSANWGVEGETDSSEIRNLRLRQAKNLLSLLFISRGTPMLLGGDELWRTQYGNNNTYCQDNELSWLNWTLTPETIEMRRFTRSLVAFRRKHPALKRPTFADPFASDGTGAIGSIGADVKWHGIYLLHPDWSYHSHSLALQIQGTPPAMGGKSLDCDFYIICNAWQKGLTFVLPKLPPHLRWYRVIDTGLPSPDDILEEERAIIIEGETYNAREHTVVVLISQANG